MPELPTPEPVFGLAYTALRPTEWAQNPLVSDSLQRGYLRVGETVRLSEPPPGSGPHWQVGQLPDGRVCFIRPRDYEPVHSTGTLQRTLPPLDC